MTDGDRPKRRVNSRDLPNWKDFGRIASGRRSPFRPASLTSTARPSPGSGRSSFCPQELITRAQYAPPDARVKRELPSTGDSAHRLRQPALIDRAILHAHCRLGAMRWRTRRDVDWRLGVMTSRRFRLMGVGSGHQGTSPSTLRLPENLDCPEAHRTGRQRRRVFCSRRGRERRPGGVWGTSGASWLTSGNSPVQKVLGVEGEKAAVSPGQSLGCLSPLSPPDNATLHPISPIRPTMPSRLAQPDTPDWK